MMHEELQEITDSQEIKRLLLNILLFVRDICEKNNLTYYLTYGTLLGAIRHKGFIPWDDDIDIMMPRPDYNRFVSLMSDQSNQYRILSPAQKDYYYNFVKVVDTDTVLFENGHKPIENMGLYIDVFPLDGMPEDQTEREKKNRELLKIRRKISSFGKKFPHIRKNILQYIFGIWRYIRGQFGDLSSWQSKYLQAVNQLDYDESKYVYITGGTNEIKSGLNSIFPVQWLEKTTKVLFEGEYYSVPAAYEKILRQLYGDYMSPPSKEKQISVHDYSVYYKLHKQRN